MPIQDIAQNQVANPTNGQMLGYTAPPTSAEALTLSQYDFLIEQIRLMDLKEGNLFLKRFLAGPQQIWAETQAAIFALKNLWSIEKIKDEHLQFLKRIVGWTPDLDNITERLAYAELRRLIAASVPLWKKRGPEDAMLEVIGLCLTSSVRMKIWNWFDFRWVNDETILDESHQGQDPWMLQFPGLPELVEYYSNLRIVDNGSLDRTLVEELVKLMRSAGERIEISYISFLDQFKKDGDNRQWEALDTDALATPLKEQFVVEDGVLKSVAGATGGLSRIIASTAIIPEALEWTEYVAFWRMRASMITPGASPYYGPIFYYTDASNYYYLRVRPNWPDSFGLAVASSIELRKVVAGVDSSILLFDYYAATGNVLSHNVFYGFRVHIAPEGATSRIKVYVDAAEVINTTDADHSRGAIGVIRTNTASYELDEAEVFQLPLETVLIDINS